MMKEWGDIIERGDKIFYPNSSDTERIYVCTRIRDWYGFVNIRTGAIVSQTWQGYKTFQEFKENVMWPSRVQIINRNVKFEKG